MAYPVHPAFEWDPAKAESNLRKHGVSFEEARTLLRRTEGVLQEYDPVHSADENRFWAVGPGRRGLIRVSFTEPVEGVLRLLGARHATRSETMVYERWWRGKRP